MSVSFRCLKSCSLKEDSLVCFLSSVGSEFQSLAPACLNVLLPDRVLARGRSIMPLFRNALPWSLLLLVK